MSCFWACSTGLTGLGEAIGGNGFGVSSLGLADFTRPPAELGLGQSRLGVTGFTGVRTCGEGGTSAEDLGSGAWAPDLVPARSVAPLVSFGDTVLSACTSAFTGRGEGT